MHIEVEQKYRVASHSPTVAALGAWDIELGEPVEQVDCYYRHPERDFAQTDEAFRLRTVGDQNFMTYKGPKLDQTTKTRREEEVRFADGPAARESCQEILRHLSFEPVATVTKHRITCHLKRDGFDVDVAMDRVEEIGTFVEIEIAVPVSRDAERVADERLAAANRVLANLANEMGLSEVERRSYLELLLAERNE